MDFYRGMQQKICLRSNFLKSYTRIDVLVDNFQPRRICIVHSRTICRRANVILCRGRSSWSAQSAHEIVRSTFRQSASLLSTFTSELTASNEGVRRARGALHFRFPSRCLGESKIGEDIYVQIFTSDNLPQKHFVKNFVISISMHSEKFI